MIMMQLSHTGTSSSRWLCRSSLYFLLLLYFSCLFVEFHANVANVTPADRDASAQARQIDWSSFVERKTLNSTKCMDIISGVPIKRYYDSAKQSYRVGVLVDETDRPLPVLIQQRTPDGSKAVVDTTNLFMSIIGGVQLLHELWLQLKKSTDATASGFNESGAIILNYQNRLVQTNSSRHIAALRSIVSNKIETVNAKLETARGLMNKRTLTSGYYLGNLTELHGAHLQRFAELTNDHARNLSLAESTRTATLEASMQNFALEEQIVEVQSMHDEFALNTERLRRQLHNRLEAIRFRFEEEARIEREVEPHSLRLLSVKNDLAVESMEKIWGAAFDIFELGCQQLLTNPLLVVQWCVLAIIIFIGIAVVTELYTWAKRYVTSSRSGVGRFSIALPTSESVAWLYKSNVLRIGPNTNLVLDGGVEAHLSGLVKLLSRAAQEQKFMLPNILLLSNSGCGRSSFAKAIALWSGLPQMTITGPEFEQIAQQGAMFSALKATIGSMVHAHNSVVLIFDDFDSIISPRSSLADVSLSHQNSFYALLDILNAGSGVSIILTASTTVAADHSSVIDSAILDRIDHIISIPKPGQSCRLDILLLQSLEELHALILSEKQQVLLTGMVRSMGKPNDAYERTCEILSGYRSRPVDIESFDKYYLSTIKTKAVEAFDIVYCLALLVLISEGWSNRELLKMVKALRARVLSSDECELTTELWVSEVRAKLREKESMKHIVAHAND